VHRAGVKRGTAGNERARGRDRARERWATAGIEVPGEGRAARIEVGMVGNERTWGGDQVRGQWVTSTGTTAIERVWSRYRGHERGRG
jgi:hypothetical protein